MLLKPVAQFASRHSREILLAISVAGVVTTAVFAADGHSKAQDIRYEVDPEDRGKTVWNAVKARWTYYVPAVGSGVLTVSAILMGARVASKQIAALTVAYSASEKALDSFRKAANKVIRDPKQRKELEETVATEHIMSSEKKADAVFIGDGQILCHDAYSGRYFSSTREDIRRAVNDINAELLANDYASLNMFYTAIGLKEVRSGDELGWNTDHRCDVVFAPAMDAKGRPCIDIAFKPDPIPGWWTRG